MNIKVLLTDDSQTIRIVLRGLLNQIGITDIVEAGNGVDALNAFKSESPNIAFMDIHMPKMDGLDCLEKIRKNPEWNNVPIVIISSDTDTRMMSRARELGAFGYIKKPFRVDGLKAAIEAAMNGIRPAQQPEELAPVEVAPIARPAQKSHQTAKFSPVAKANPVPVAKLKPVQKIKAATAVSAPVAEKAPEKSMFGWLKRIFNKQ